MELIPSQESREYDKWNKKRLSLSKLALSCGETVFDEIVKNHMENFGLSAEQAGICANCAIELRKEYKTIQEILMNEFRGDIDWQMARSQAAKAEEEIDSITSEYFKQLKPYLEEQKEKRMRGSGLGRI